MRFGAGLKGSGNQDGYQQRTEVLLIVSGTGFFFFTIETVASFLNEQVLKSPHTQNLCAGGCFQSDGGGHGVVLPGFSQPLSGALN